MFQKISGKISGTHEYEDFLCTFVHYELNIYSLYETNQHKIRRIMPTTKRKFLTLLGTHLVTVNALQ